MKSCDVDLLDHVIAGSEHDLISNALCQRSFHIQMFTLSFKMLEGSQSELTELQ